MTDGYASKRDMKLVRTVVFLCQCVQEKMERVTNEDSPRAGEGKNNVHKLWV